MVNVKLRDWDPVCFTASLLNLPKAFNKSVCQQSWEFAREKKHRDNKRWVGMESFGGLVILRCMPTLRRGMQDRRQIHEICKDRKRCCNLQLKAKNGRNFEDPLIH